MVAFIVSVLVEIPTVGLIKLIFPRAKSKQLRQESPDMKLEEIKEAAQVESSKPPPIYQLSDHSEKTPVDDHSHDKGALNNAFENRPVTLL